VIKGSHLIIEGKIKNRSYEDRNQVKRYITEIYADNFEMLGKKESNSEPMQQQKFIQTEKLATPLPRTSSGDIDYSQLPVDNDLPF